MGNSCKKVIQTRRNRTPPDQFNHRFDFVSDNNSSWNNMNYYNDVYLRNFNREREPLKGNDHTLALNDESNFNANSSLVYIDELYDILENEEKVKIKKVDNSDVEEFLIIEKHIKLKRKKKKNNPFKKKKEKNVKKEMSHSSLRHINGDNNGNHFDVPCFPGDNSLNKEKNKMKDRASSKIAEVETWCSSSNDNRYDIFEEDRKHMLKQRQMNMKDDRKMGPQNGGKKGRDNHNNDQNAQGKSNSGANKDASDQGNGHNRGKDDFSLTFEPSEEKDSQKGKETDKKVGKKTYKKGGKDADKKVGKDADKKVGKDADKKVGKDADKKVGKYADKKVGKEADKKADKAANKIGDIFPD
ncbi:hypothetical protein C922_01161 [Plasmodium inui San Antonio 1]|uniref:Uncharacterized protein n=1 Tax=Plasmodium inui San Antonio 1 TaxID=1237626 RepID=W7AA46_9APIC|nr:hypothetical protein C922_01161 [Plasmodium inui San Antonio 1]EUD68143.1 hypothetical protein C922_01161 [Plasmodium inui San Antonio 1]